MKKSKRLKPETNITSHAEFENVLDEIANLQIERDKKVLKRDKALLDIREAFCSKECAAPTHLASPMQHLEAIRIKLERNP